MGNYRLVDYASGTGRRRLDWWAFRKLLREPSLQRLILDRTAVEVSFNLDGIDYLNGDGLVMLLALGDVLSRKQHEIYLQIPPTNHQALLRSGFLALSRRFFRVRGIASLSEFGEDAVLPPGFRLTVNGIDSDSVLALQRGFDAFVRSPAFYQKLNLESTSEAGYEYGPSLGRALHELLKNIIQHSGIRSGMIAVEQTGNFSIQLTLADCGIGLEESLRVRGLTVRHLDPLRLCVLHRFYYPDREGLFTVCKTLRRWGGELEIRSGSMSYTYRAKPGQPDDEQLASELESIEPEAAPFFPGVQCRIAFTIPRSSR
jgi:hypothetical protein